jgi:UDP-N-acetylmuramoylalanine-D-glutamate ligase
MQLQGQHVLILGLGASGLAMARWCAHAGANVTVADTRDTPPQLAALQAEWPEVRFVPGPFGAELVEGTSVRAVFRSPGLTPVVVTPVLDAAKNMGLWQGGELSLFVQGLRDLKTRFGYAPQVLAITGTNGKTSTAWWLAHALHALGRGCAVVGTLGMGDVAHAAQWSQGGGLTTPDAVVLQAQLRQYVDQGLAACAIEASSIGLREHRLDGTHLRLALFTNFSQDHLDYHASMDDYWQAKAALFDWPDLPAAVVNVDDAQGRSLAHQLMARQQPADVWTVSCQGAARLQARHIRWQAQPGAAFALAEAHASAGDWPAAETASRRALAEAPASTPARRQLAALLLRDAGLEALGRTVELPHA